jgi:hypothetical protein
MTVHRRALALAAVLAATVVTGGAAIMGISRPAAAPAPSPAATPAVVVQQAPAPHNFEEAD